MLSKAELQEVLLSDIKALNLDPSSMESLQMRQIEKSLTKKFVGIETDPEADRKALELFKQCNALCRSWSIDLSDARVRKVYETVKNRLDGFVHRGPELLLNFDDVLSLGGVGPGASLEAIHDDFYTKLFGGPLSCTDVTLPHYYREAVRSCPSWFRAEEARQAAFGTKVVEGSRLSFVPKTSDISRSICTEPVLNMFFQKWIGASLEKQLARAYRITFSNKKGIPCSDQASLNRELAREGSISQKFGTIDLSSASDTISLGLVEQLFPRYFVNWVKRSRSPTVVFPDGSSERLHMVSSMGNGFTFPLETAIFATTVVACYEVLGVKPRFNARGPENFGVFGDDIVVLSDCYDLVVKCLKAFGFLVNEDKSFNTGYFRESCGGDYYMGTDVRGVYCGGLNCRPDVFSLVNRLVRWSARTGVYLHRTVAALMECIEGKPLIVPPEAGDGEGIKYPYPPSDAGRSRDTGGIYYRYLAIKPVQARFPEDESRRVKYPTKGRGRLLFYNPEGVLQALLGGFIRDGTLSYRTSDRPRYKVRRRCTSSWYSGPAGFKDRGSEWKLAAEILINL